LLWRLAASTWPYPPGYRRLRTAWGKSVLADPGRAIGRSIATTGVFDLAVSELLARLIRRDDRVIDAGANIGYMTLLAATCLGESGHVDAFEPHPGIYEVLCKNLIPIGQDALSQSVTLHRQALGPAVGTADLHIPNDFAGNDGVASIAASDKSDGVNLPVEVTTLDVVLGMNDVGVLKLDVEGYEEAVLRGAESALTGGRIRDIVFEDHDAEQSPAIRLLEDAGYDVYSVGWNLHQLVLNPMADHRRNAHEYEAPSYVATRDSGALFQRLKRPGWMVLSARLRDADFCRRFTSGSK
ncbi:MAG TPA: FkbM family methyltransferase, partial [Planctomycetaceae bacterium]|nr:FkbM family methyltransferase [Planctomycetaceae bacterium]